MNDRRRPLVGWNQLEAWATHAEEQAALPSSPHPFTYHLSIPIIAATLESAARVGAADGDAARDDVRSRVLKYLFPVDENDRPLTYLRSGWANAVELQQHEIRVVQLAELLYNLQTVPGITHIYRRIISDPLQIEATVLELSGLSMLWRARIPFRIIHTGADQGLNYDCELTLPGGETAYCEMTCKVEGSSFDTERFRSKLNEERGQLPADRCGVIFLKIPDAWVVDLAIMRQLEPTITNFLAKTSRVADVVLYTDGIITAHDGSAHITAVKEFVSDRPAFQKLLGQGLFHNRPSLSWKENPGWLPIGWLTPDLLRRLLEAQRRGSPDGPRPNGS